MSFDVYLKQSIEDYWIGNYTGNLGGYFRWALSEDGITQDSDKTRCDSRDAIFGTRYSDGLGALDEMKACDAIPLLERALSRTEVAPLTLLESFNAPNGWGTWHGARDYLRKILNACKEHPSETLRVSL